MGASVADRTGLAQRHMLKMGGEGHLNKVEKVDKATIGRSIQRALDYADLTAKCAAAEMGYSDPTIVSRWIAGAESPNLAKFCTLGPRVRRGLLLALAETFEADAVEIETTVRFKSAVNL